MSNLSWLSNKEFAQLLAASGHTPDLCAEAARRFEALADFEAGWSDLEYDRGSPEEINAVIAGLEEELSAEEKAHEETRQLYEAALQQIDVTDEKCLELQRELDELRMAVAEDERTCCNCGERL